MFCSNCGKSLRRDEESCRHCGAILGKNRFYGSTYTSSQVRLPASQINDAPTGGRMSYTRTDYMAFGNPPADDIYSRTTYRPLLSEEEDLSRIEAEEARLQEELARAEQERLAAEMARAEEEARLMAEAAQAVEEVNASSEQNAAEQNAAVFEADAEPVEDEAADVAEQYFSQESEWNASSADKEDDGEDDGEEYEDDEVFDVADDETAYPEDIKEGVISSRVLQYMEEQERLQNEPPRKTSGLRITPFLDLARKFVPIEAQDSAAQEKAAGNTSRESASENAPKVSLPKISMPKLNLKFNRPAAPVQEAPIVEELVEEMPVDEVPAEEAYFEQMPAEEGYVEEGMEQADTYLDDEDMEYTASAEQTEAGAEDVFSTEEFDSSEYTLDGNDFESFPENGYSEEGYAEAPYAEESFEGLDSFEAESADEYGAEDMPAFQFDFAELWQRIRDSLIDLLKNRTITIAVAAVLVIAVLIGGISWLNFVTAKRAKISGVTYSAYSQGIEMLTANTSEEYRSERQQLYLTNTAMAANSFSEDITALNLLLPKAPQENDELFINALTNIQDAIAKTIKEDAQAELSGRTNLNESAAKWQSINHAISQLSLATTPAELVRILSELDSVVNPTPAPTPVPTPVQYKTLSVGMMDDMQVRIMQNALINLGYLSGEADGDFGPGTESAVKAFQRAAGLTANGVGNQETLTALYSPDAPRTGGSAPSNPSAN